MRRIVAVVSLGILLYMICSSLSLDFGAMDSIDIEERDSNAYLKRSVTDNPGEVIFGESKDVETGSANVVSAIVVEYRSFDTLGEVTVLFMSSLGVAFVLGGLAKRVKYKYEAGFVQRAGSRIVFGFILLFGIYMFLHGHLSPGGGFPGGAIIAAAFLLLYLSDDRYRPNMKVFKFLEGTAGTLYITTGLVGFVLGGYFLQNFLPTGTVGNLFSSGVMPVIYVLVGLKVGSELTGIFDYFVHEEVGG